MMCVNVYFITWFIDELGSTCINIHLHSRRGSYSWQFGPCHSSQQYSGSNTYTEKYTEKCCAPNGEHIFSCKDTKGGGWDHSLVKIGGHQFCDDIVGYEKMIAINITGGAVQKFPS